MNNTYELWYVGGDENEAWCGDGHQKFGCDRWWLHEMQPYTTSSPCLVWHIVGVSLILRAFTCIKDSKNYSL